jgi:hypothetical protein
MIVCDTHSCMALYYRVYTHVCTHTRVYHPLYRIEAWVLSIRYRVDRVSSAFRGTAVYTQLLTRYLGPEPVARRWGEKRA